MNISDDTLEPNRRQVNLCTWLCPPGWRNANSVPEWAFPDVKKDIDALRQVLVNPERCAYDPEHVKVSDKQMTFRVVANTGERDRCRIVYLDPRSRTPVPFNPLVARWVEPYVIAQGVIEAFMRTWPAELAAAPRFANIVLHSLLVLIANRLSLLDMPRLLTNRA